MYGVDEVFGVGSDDDGFGEGGGFDHVGATQGDEGSADEDDGGEVVELAEVAEGVAEDDDVLVGGCWLIFARFYLAVA